MKIFYTDIFVLPLPPGHHFPMEKYRLLRDRLVFTYCCERRIPVAVAMACGYARSSEDTVDIHFRTVQTAAAMAADFAGISG